MSELALFPLQSVLFPEGELRLKVFEARYLDLMGRCLRGGLPFGVVCLKRGSEVQRPESSDTVFEAVGVAAQVEDVDMPQTGIMLVRARGKERFRVSEASRHQDGLWVAHITTIDSDEPVAPDAAHASTVLALGNALAHLREMFEAGEQNEMTSRGTAAERMDDAGWVANRWCELLPIPMVAKQSLMELQDPRVRLSLVDRYLRDKGVVR